MDLHIDQLQNSANLLIVENPIIGLNNNNTTYQYQLHNTKTQHKPIIIDNSPRKFHSPSASALMTNSYTNNKYRTNAIRKVDIETVIANRLNPSPSAKLQKLNDMLVNSNIKGNIPNERPFYYSKKNEMLSVQEFLNFYKSTESQRIFQDKQRLRARVEEAREKIEEIQHINEVSPRIRPKSSMTNRSSLPAPKLQLKNLVTESYSISPRPETAGPFSAKPNIISIGFPTNSTRKSMESQRSMLSVHSHSMKFAKKTYETLQKVETTETDQVNTDANDHNNAITQENKTQFTEMNEGNNNNEGYLQKALPSVSNNPIDIQKDKFNFTEGKRKFKEPKFTEREIYRHLIHLTVSPRHLTLQDQMSASNKERMIQTLFKDPRILDCRMSLKLGKSNDTNIESSLKKSNLEMFCESEEGHLISSDTNNKNSSEVADKEGLKNLSTKEEDISYMYSISEKINKNVKELDDYIKYNRRSTFHALNYKLPKSVSGGSPKSAQIISSNCQTPCYINHGLDNINKNLNLDFGNISKIKEDMTLKSKNTTPTYAYKSKKVPLRSVIAKKYNIIQKINLNKKFTQDIRKAIGETKKTILNQAAIKNRDHVDLYI